MEYEIKTTKENRDAIIEKLHPYGIVVNRWPDGTFKFRFYDEECVDEGTDDLEELEVEFQLVS